MQEKWDALREDGRKAMKNKSKSAYDITTLQYFADEDGDAQKYADDMGRKHLHLLGDTDNQTHSVFIHNSN